MQVSGDRIAGFYRTADREGRHVEAYSWGGLTSGSAWRVLWLLLLPFAMANMAARMFPPWLPGRPRRFAVFRWAAGLASFGLTLNLVLLAAAIPVDYVAYQCGGRAGVRALAGLAAAARAARRTDPGGRAGAAAGDRRPVPAGPHLPEPLRPGETARL
ncbi:hypothetical protein GCM10020001_094090 [Nonomuraea salmonea]